MWVYVVSVQRKEAVDDSTWKALLGIYSDLDKVKEHYPNLQPDGGNTYTVPGHPYNTDEFYVYVSGRHMDEGCAEPYKRHQTAGK